MFRILGVATISAMVALSAHAGDDVEAWKTEYYDARGDCRSPEPTTTDEAMEIACESLDVLGKKLTLAGQCWDNSELVWDKCPMTN